VNAARLREIARMAARATPDKVHALYMEIYGADFAGKVTLDRARQSIKEAVKELLDKGGKAHDIVIDEPPRAAQPPPTSTHSEESPPKGVSHIDGTRTRRKPLFLEPL
jgi:hypothetical protein